MAKKKKLPPLTVVRGNAQTVRAEAQRILAEQRIPVQTRKPSGNPRDGVFGLGSGPPGTGTPPPVYHEPGGDVVTQQLMHPTFQNVEELFRTLPDESFFSPLLTPDRPYEFPIGSYQVPKNMQLWLTDFDFGVLRQSGIDPGDFVLAEDWRFSGVMGFDIQISGKRYGNISYQLDPAPIPNTTEIFEPPIPTVPGRDGVAATPSQFNRAQANSFAATSGAGSSLLPVRRGPYGPRGGPFTIVVEEDQFVELRCTVFREVTTPIAGVQAILAGFQVHTNLGQALLGRLRPQ